jgi:segregation and condensation protein B
MSDHELPSELSAFFEAVLFIAERPLGSSELAEIAGVPRLHAEAALGLLGDELQESGRGLRLQRHGDDWQLVTAPAVGERLAAYAAREEARVTPAALEALAVVAYRQPCTRADIDRVRGVDSDYVLRSLMHRRLVAEVGRRDAPGRPILYGTTFTFLERFGLTSLDDLPPLASDAAEMVAAAGVSALAGVEAPTNSPRSPDAG